MIPSQELQSDWVFNPKEDSIIFLGSLFFASLFAAFIPANIDMREVLIWFFLANLINNIGHVIATAVPVYLEKNQSRWIKFIPVWSFLIVSIVYFFSEKLFEVLLAYITLHHIIKQYYGWHAKAGRSEENPIVEKWSLVALVTVILVPVLYWHMGLSAVELTYYHKNDLMLRIPKEWATNLLMLHWIIVGICIAIFIRYRHLLNRGRMIVIFSSWVSFYVGLVVCKSPVFFWTSLMFVHGFSYHRFIFNRQKRNASSPLTLFAYSLFILVGATLWYKSAVLVQLTSNIFWLHKIVVPLAWTPLFSHYYFDAVLWRRKRTITEANPKFVLPKQESIAI